MDELNRLAAACQGPVFVEFNPHRAAYQSADVYLGGIGADPEVAADVRAEMVASDRVVVVQFYPDTPVVFCRVVHFDAGEAVREALAILGEEGDVTG